MSIGSRRLNTLMQSFHQFLTELTLAPGDVKDLTVKLNKEINPLTVGPQPRVPVSELVAILKSHGLDPKNIQNSVHGDTGRLHVAIGSGIFLVMTWYKFQTGKYEIVAYATSEHDDHKPVAKPMSSGERQKAKAAVSKELNVISSKYWKSLGLVQGAISDALERGGFDAEEFQTEMSRSTAGKNDSRVHVAVGNGLYLAVSIHKMEVTGNYEITAYVS